MKTQTVFSIMIMALMIFITAMSNSQEARIELTAEEKTQVVDSIALFMTERYVFAEEGKQMGDLVKENLEAGKYDDIADPNAFSRQLTEDLLTVNNDRHIGVMFVPERIAMMQAAEEDENNTELEDLERRFMEFSNYNFKKIEILPGNVGYLKFNSFEDASFAGPTAVAAMNFLANTDALIIDLTDNGGGSPSLIQLITTYFFEYPTHLNSFYYREADQTRQFWTLTHVPGDRMPETNIYVLTSSRTFSGAEEFSYNLQNLERAVLVGETTGGGAHPVAAYIINDHFMVRVPFGRAVNPISETNWEGTGVEPHVKTSKDKAFVTAYSMALDSLIKSEENEDIRAGLKWAYDGLKAKLEPVKVDESTLKTYAGAYGPRKITFEDGSLYYQREDRPKMKMVPITETVFGFKELDYFRIEILVEDGEVVAVRGLYEGGRTDMNERTK